MLTNGYVNFDRTKCFYEVHTHDASGIIHLHANSGRVLPFTLGQLFAVWGRTLSREEVAGNAGSVIAYVNQQLFTGDLGSIVLADHTQVTLEVGEPRVKPPTSCSRRTRSRIGVISASAPLAPRQVLRWRRWPDDSSIGDAHCESARRSSIRAFAQSRCTVRVVTPSASAVSSSLKPPKNRHSTTRASLGSTAASRSIALLSPA